MVFNHPSRTRWQQAGQYQVERRGIHAEVENHHQVELASRRLGAIDDLAVWPSAISGAIASLCVPGSGAERTRAALALVAMALPRRSNHTCGQFSGVLGPRPQSRTGPA